MLELLVLLVLLVLVLVAVGGWDPLCLLPQVELSLRVLGIRNRPIQPSSLSYALHCILLSPFIMRIVQSHQHLTMARPNHLALYQIAESESV